MFVEVKDEMLLQALRRGDRDALARLYQRHSPLVWRFSLGLARDHRLADDALQEAFLQLARHPDRFDPTRAALGTWLCAIARNRLRHLSGRDSRYEPADELPDATDPAPGPFEILDRHQTLAALRDAVDRLPDAFREVVLLCAYEEMPYEEASVVLGIPLGTVRSRLSRAKAILARTLQEERRTVPHGSSR